MKNHKSNGSSESRKGENGKSGAKPFSKSSLSKSGGTQNKSGGNRNKSGESQNEFGENQSTELASKLQKLMEDQLKDIYWAEQALTKAIPKMIQNSTSDELITALKKHLGETETQVTRLEKVFELLGKKAESKKCEAMAGLIKEAEENMDDSEEGVMRDAGIIIAGQKVEHYEIASYGSLKTFARTLGHDDVADILEEILEEEKAADATLSEVAETAINVQAAAEPVEED